MIVHREPCRPTDAWLPLFPEPTRRMSFIWRSANEYLRDWRPMEREPNVSCWCGILFGALCLGLINLSVLPAAATSRSRDGTKWSSGSGNWTEVARWSAGLPDPYTRVEVHGNGTLRVPAGTYAIANLQIGKHYAD